MSGFVASPEQLDDGLPLEYGPFWPNIHVDHFCETQRIGGTLIPKARLEEALSGAVITVDRDLEKWRAAREAEGNAALVDCPSPTIGGETRLVRIWRRAVYSYATADLVETHRDVTATGQGAAATSTFDARAEDHRRNALHAIRDILGAGRSTIELI